MTERITGILYGGFSRRFIAYAVDKLILCFVSLFLFLIALSALELGGGLSLNCIIATENLPHKLALCFAAYTAIAIVSGMLYSVWFHGSVGQTPGKMLLELCVIQSSGEAMTFGVAFLRWVGTLLSGLTLALGYLWIAMDGKKQGWHDKLAATLVVRTVVKYDYPLPSVIEPAPQQQFTEQAGAGGALAPEDPYANIP